VKRDDMGHLGLQDCPVLMVPRDTQVSRVWSNLICFPEYSQLRHAVQGQKGDPGDAGSRVRNYF
jgi:hypothetical protein